MSATSKDRGFTMIEVVVSLAIVSTLSAALAPFLVRSVSVIGEQRERQVAVDLADDAVERVAALTGPAALRGRGYTAAKQQWDAASSVPSYASALRPLLNSMSLGDPQYATDPAKTAWLAWDLQLPVTSTAGSSAGVPTTAVDVPTNGVRFQENWYLGMCRQQFGTGGTCDNPNSPDPDPTRADVPMLRAVVAVSWPSRACTGNLCTYVTSTLISTSADLIFKVTKPAPAVVNPGAQTSYALVATAGLQLTATAGQTPLTWSFSGLPPGLTGSAGGLVTGTPADPLTTRTYAVTATVSDQLGRTASATFDWTVVPAPVVTNPGNQTNRTGTAVTLTMVVTGGGNPISWSATGLPAGLSIDANTGVISGTPTAAVRTTTSVTVKATDKVGRSSSVTFSWTILTLAVPSIGGRDNAMRDNVSFTVPLPTGGTGPFTYRMKDYPGDYLGDISIDPNTGVISGRVLSSGRYLTTIYVKDATGDEVSTTFLWYVAADHSNDLNITTPDPANPDQSGKVGRAVSLLVQASAGSNSGYEWTATGLPPGLTIASKTDLDGLISGTPTTAGTYRVTLVCQDSNRKRAVVMFDWTVNP